LCIATAICNVGRARTHSPLLYQEMQMKWLMRAFSIIHGCMAALFACAALMLIIIATKEAWIAFFSGLNRSAAQQIIEAIGVLAAAVVALQISQTIAEEEVMRDAHISGPTRIRRFLSRFMVVIVVAIAIEGLVATFRAAHENSTQLVYAAGILVAAGVLLAAWGVFVRLNRYAEELEPEAMAQAKSEDRKLE
jgi:Ni/Fe-hydrogenase subunit HybB-like protein